MRPSENATTEFRREYSPDINRTVVAFANTEGGVLYLGVTTEGGVVGVPDVDSTLLRVAGNVRDSIRPNLTPFVEYQTEVVNGRTVVAVVVQRGAACPYYLADRGIRPEGVFLRQGVASVPATRGMIERMIRETDGERYEIMRSLEQELTFAEAEKEFEARGIPFGLAPRKTLRLMNDDGVYTNLGLLLSDQCTHFARVAVFEGKTRAIFKERREFTGSLLRQVNDLWEFLNRYNPVRGERRDYPVAALGEALLNAFVHRDYLYGGSTMVDIFDDRMEFVSLGGLPEGISLDDISMGVSVARNENLLNVFYKLALVVAHGTGIQKIAESYAASRAKPKIEATGNVCRVTLPNANLEEEAKRLTENERIVTALLALRESIARKDAEKALGLSQAMSVRILRALVEKGEIRAVGKGKNTRYVAV